MSQGKPPVMSAFWVSLWAIALSMTWLLPNHFPPWPAFHSDVWVGGITWLGCGAVIWSTRRGVEWDLWALVAMGLACIPWAQWTAGQLPFIGQAWISSLYILGFGLALQVGRQWEQVTPGQLPRALLGAIGIAALVSVGLQLYTWLGLQSGDMTDIASMGQTGSRPYGNLGQPNLLATLLIWALLATIWAFQERLLSAGSATAAAVFLLLGIALTQSRTGQLERCALLLAVWFWRGLWRSPQLPKLAFLLFILFWFMPAMLASLHALIFPEDSVAYSHGLESGNVRLKIWRLLLGAVGERPCLGYGWTEVTRAQVEVSNRFPAIGELFGQSHNLFLDFVLWIGLPAGLALSIALCYAGYSLYKHAKEPMQIVLFFCIAAVAMHAMLELPLHYAFFLLPVGLMVGVLRANHRGRSILASGYWPMLLLWVLVGTGIAVTTSDYLRVEDSYNALRMEKARIGVAKTGIGKPPEVLVLTHLRDWIWSQRLEIRAGMSEEDMATVDALTGRFPSAVAMYNMAKMDGLNQNAPRAQYWLDRLCKFTDQQGCQYFQRAWTKDAAQNEALRELVWPVEQKPETQPN